MRGRVLIASVAFIAMLVGLTFPSDGSAYEKYGKATGVCPFSEPCVFVALTATGPSPSTAKIYPISDVLIFVNQDSVAHTVVFADGRCSLNVPPGEPPVNESDFTGRHGQWPTLVGSYDYTVDGTFPGKVDVVGFYRSVSLTARTHTIRLGSPLSLHGQLTLTNPSGGPGLCGFSGLHTRSPVVRVLARHNRSHPFQRIAMFDIRLKGQSSNRGCNYAWHLTVRPGLRTTYIADSKLSADLWKQATSRPFTVLIRH